eukprot:gnl/Spiro4/22503_TR11101_c0_g3_i4.p1 gnl/Spiro4/22503_TR11101_c0_g3~~gnl/Spiro4/22503_TR11101_c0_g3_i4.p1  ORF type:complete len:772 (+),score=220.90 gnl/Spiro4/22503_TR11101_c0_g3_i4:40-2355(+)
MARSLWLLSALSSLLLCVGAWPSTVGVSEKLERAVRQSYERVPAPFTAEPEVLAKLIDTLVSERAKAHATEDVERDRKHVVMWLILLSGWASLDSLEVLTQQLAARNLQICVDGFGATLADVLLYLYSKGHFNRYFAHTVANTEDAEKCTTLRDSTSSKMNELWYNLAHSERDRVSAPCTLLADSMMLRRLRDVKAFREHVSSKKDSYRFVFPFGYEGVNVFDTRLVASDGKIDGWYHKLPDPATLSKAGDPLQLMVAEIERLTKAQLPEELSDVQVEFVSPGFPFLADEEAKKSFLALDSSDLVKTYLLPNFRYTVPTLASWRKIFEIYSDDPETQLDIANTLSQYGLFYSVNMLGDRCADLHSGLKKLLAEMGEGFGDVQFHIPQGMKSYGLVTMLFFMQFPELSTATIAYYGTPINPDRTVVILDDFAGSGSSLRNAASFLAYRGQKAPIYPAPLLQTTAAQSKINDSKEYPESRLAVVESVAGFQLTPEYSSRRPWMGEAGFEGSYLIVLPYMSPDNDCSFVQYIVAPLLTFAGRGAKQQGELPPRYQRYMSLLRAPPFQLDKVMEKYLLYLPDETPTYLCSAEGKEKYPVLLAHTAETEVQPQRTTIQEASRRVGALFNWVIPKNKKLVLGLLTLDNPLQLGVSFPELAHDEQNKHSEMYMAGQVKVNKLSLEFSLDKYFENDFQPQQIVDVLTHLIADSIDQKGLAIGSAAFVAAPRPTEAHFREACDKKYTVHLSRDYWEASRDGQLPSAKEKQDGCTFEHQCE